SKPDSYLHNVFLQSGLSKKKASQLARPLYSENIRLTILDRICKRYVQLKVVVNGLVSEVIKKATGAVFDIVFGAIDHDPGRSLCTIQHGLKANRSGNAFDGHITLYSVGICL